MVIEVGSRVFGLCSPPQGVSVVPATRNLAHSREAAARMAGLEQGEFKEGHQLDAQLIKGIQRV